MRPVLVFDESMIPGPPAVLPIIENGGQLDEPALFHVKGYDYEVRFNQTGLTAFRWKSSEGSGAGRSELTFEGASPSAVVTGEAPFSGVLNFIKGADESRWANGLTVYRKIRYENLYSGVTLTVEGRHGRLVQTFEVTRGVDPGVIRLAYAGATVDVVPGGGLTLASKTGTQHVARPDIYEVDGGSRRRLQGGFVATPSGEVTFVAAGRNGEKPLVIEAEIAIRLYDDIEPLEKAERVGKRAQDEPYFTYVGGTGFEFGRGVHVFADGDVAVVLETNSAGLPASDDAFQTEPAGDQSDAYVIRFRPSNGEIIWATYYGSDQEDLVSGLACLENLSNCVIAGATSGALPGSGIGKTSLEASSSYVAMFDSETGRLFRVLQDGHAFNTAYNDVFAGRGLPDVGYILPGFESNGNDLNGTLTQWRAADDWASVTKIANQDPSTDNTFFDAVQMDDRIFVVGASDGVPDQIVSSPGITDPYFAVLLDDQLTVMRIQNAEKAWYQGIEVVGSQICVTQYTDLDASGQVANKSAVDCFNPSTGDLLDDFLLRRGVFSGDGFPQQIAADPASNLFLSRLLVGNQGEPRVEISVIDLPPNPEPLWDKPSRTYEVSSVPQALVVVNSLQTSLDQTVYFGTGFTGMETSPTAPEAFQDLPDDGVAGILFIDKAPAYTGVTNLQSEIVVYDVSIPRISLGPGFHDFSLSIAPGAFSGGYPHPSNQNITVTLAGRDPIVLSDLNQVNYVILDGDDSFTASVKEIPSRGNSLTFINATGEEINVKSGLTVKFDTWDTDENVEDKGIIVVPQSSQESDGGILFRVTDLGTGAFEEFRIPEEFASQEVRDQAGITTLVIDNLPGSGKSGAQGIRLLAFDLGGASIETQVVTSTEDPDELPASYRLHQNYPNPFNPSTAIAFDVPVASRVRLAITNTLGQRVWEWSNEWMSPGQHTISWDGRDYSGRPLPSGSYFYRIEAQGFVGTGKMSLIR